LAARASASREASTSYSEFAAAALANIRSAVVKRGGAAGSCDAPAGAGACLLAATGAGLPGAGEGVVHPAAASASRAAQAAARSAGKSDVSLFME
jgi:hypothetical protein